MPAGIATRGFPGTATGSPKPDIGAECEKLTLTTPGSCESRSWNWRYKPSRLSAGYWVCDKLVHAIRRPLVSIPSGCVSKRGWVRVKKAVVANKAKDIAALKRMRSCWGQWEM